MGRLHWLHFALVCLEGDLEDSVAKSVAVQWLDRHQGLVVVRHRNEAKALAFVSL